LDEVVVFIFVFGTCSDVHAAGAVRGQEAENSLQGLALEQAGDMQPQQICTAASIGCLPVRSEKTFSE